VIKSSVAKGTVTAPPSKSYTHRAMVLGALTHSHFTLRNPLMSEDTVATLDALHAFGTEIRSGTTGLKIHCEELRPAFGVVDAKNSGTTMRLFAGLASLLPATTTLTGDESLIRRPMGPLVDALVQLGASCAYLGHEGNPPIAVTGPISGRKAEIEGTTSSQFISSLLIACTQKETDTALKVRGHPRSRPYVDITLGMLREFGARVEEKQDSFDIPGSQHLARETYTVPGDYSSAAFPLVAAAITGGDVTVRNLDSQSLQGDRAIVDLVSAFGAKVRQASDSVRAVGGRLTGAEIDVMHTPDLFPILAVLGAVAEGRTIVKGGENLRAKESDRIATTTAFLEKMGADIVATQDGCEIEGVDRLHGAIVQTGGDHRIFMAASVAGLVASSPTMIEDADSFKVSYPGFLRDMHQLGCRLVVRR
jgi:3-phosphoshikimate 1-carboxyvinyltransferase